MTPEQLQSLRRQLPPFGDSTGLSPEMQAFCRAYGIDFEARLPEVTHTAGHIRSGNFTLAVHRWSQSDARSNLLLVHGYFDHSGLFSKLIEWGLSHHCNVVIFDLPGHGLSSGAPAVIDDFRDYSRAVEDVFLVANLPQLPWWTMAQSTGGAALIDFARHYQWPFAATVLLAPLVRPAGWRGVSAAHRLLSPFIDSVRRNFVANSSDQQFLEFLKNDPLQSQRISLRWVGALRRWLRQLAPRDLGVGPVLLIQGDADATVDWRYNTRFVRRLFPGSKVEYLHGAGHQLANESDKFRRQYLGQVELWLTQHGISVDALSPVDPC
ncbi:MAG: alpha/beta hydrolase [Halioglobus sp.]